MLARCACLPSNIIEDTMTRQRHVYETAFDCCISKSDDDLDEIDKLSNHPCLLPSSTVIKQNCNKSTFARKASQENVNEIEDDNKSMSILSQKLQEVHVKPSDESSISLSLYKSSPPSTVPLRAKFHGKEMVTNNVQSAPNLSVSRKNKAKMFHLPMQSIRVKNSTTALGSLNSDNNDFQVEIHREDVSSQYSDDNKITKRVMEIKDRPLHKPLFFQRPIRNKNQPRNVLDLKGRRRHQKFSSTESMTTSSSGGSMESLRSSTSEGNRSTTSSESRHSSSLSSHESESGDGTNYSVSLTLKFMSHANKMHILSPISDKSSQEPASETSDNNRNNFSQKCSPDEVTTPENMKAKRRLPQNKNLLNLGLHFGDPEIQGSDSGISIQSREGRRKNMSQNVPASDSPTSNYLKELPFDMPKLRRRLRVQQSYVEPSLSQASSSQSITLPDFKGSEFKPKLALNLSDPGKIKSSNLGLPLKSSHFTSNYSLFDVNLPLEKQGWFHGAISRVEAEQVLQDLKEGSFLVRNSGSSRESYSLSLKSTRGFLHVKIRKSGNENVFILGNTSNPFKSIPEAIQHFTTNRLPIPGAEHMYLIQPVILQLL